MKANETKVDKFLATNETTFAIPVYPPGNGDDLVAQTQIHLHSYQDNFSQDYNHPSF